MNARQSPFQQLHPSLLVAGHIMSGLYDAQKICVYMSAAKKYLPPIHPNHPHTPQESVVASFQCTEFGRK